MTKLGHSLVLCLLLSLPATGQNGIDSSLSLAFTLPPLDSLMELAVRNHPATQLNQAMADASFEKWKVQKRSWSTNVSGFYNYSLGNQSLLISGTAQSDITNIANGYRYGVNVTLPLAELVQRGPRVKAAKAEYDASVYKVDDVSNVIRRQVVEEYYNLLAAQELLLIKTKAYESAKINERMSQQAYRDGSITMLEYTRVLEMTGTAESEYVLARRDFNTIYKQFEVILGTPIQSLTAKP
jgi:outer membrane protein TolC